jgi:hypothetical protein
MEVLQIPGHFVYEALVLPRKRKEILLASVNEAVKFDNTPYRLGQMRQRQTRESGETPPKAPRAPPQKQKDGGLTASFSLGF